MQDSASLRVRDLAVALAAARDIEDVIAASASIPVLAAGWLAQGLGTAAITRGITACNDLVTGRLIAVSGAAPLLEAAGACWIAFGSQGRSEQTLATDQDNAIVFADDVDPGARRRTLLPAAGAVNEALARCGYDLCRGHVMAGEPGCCLSFSEWRGKFAEWIDRPDPHALLKAAIFFDFRPVHGVAAGVTALRAWLADYAPDRGRFLLQLARNVLDNQPPLGVLRDFALPRHGAHPHMLDLKINGVQPFVEGARVYALAAGLAATNTVERLAATGEARRIAKSDICGWQEAFGFIQSLRLRLNDAQRRRNEPTDNYLDPDTLEQQERRALRDALRQARGLQARLARDFSILDLGFGA